MKRDYLSFSALSAFAKSPNHYLEYVSGEKEETRAMVVGQATHCKILEPQHFEERYAVSPKVDKRTKAGKEAYAKFVEISDGKKVLQQDEYELIEALEASVRSHTCASELLKHATQMELPMETELYGVPFKGIADIITSVSIVDLKTTADASPEAFQRAAYNGKYHIQAAAYLQMARQLGMQVNPRFGWIVVEKTPPYNVQVFIQSEEAADRAQTELKQLIKRWQQWDGNPQSYTNNVAPVTLEYPRWA